MIVENMTCEQSGGPCSCPHRGTTADEVSKAQHRDLKEMVGNGDTEHEADLKDRKGRWKNPINGMVRYRQTERDVAALPER